MAWALLQESLTSTTTPSLLAFSVSLLFLLVDLKHGWGFSSPTVTSLVSGGDLAMPTCSHPLQKEVGQTHATREEGGSNGEEGQGTISEEIVRKYCQDRYWWQYLCKICSIKSQGDFFAITIRNCEGPKVSLGPKSRKVQ